MRDIVTKINSFFITVCIWSLLASLSAVPIALAIKFIMWLF